MKEYDILHRIGIKSDPNAVYEALTTRKGLSDWWTNDTQGEASVGGVIKFRFGSLGGFDMKVVELDREKRVLWQVVEGPEEWLGTKVSFELKKEGNLTLVLFKHRGWKEPVDFMHHCSTKWATYLLSLKSLIETGKGAPSPNDTKIGDFD